MFRCFLICFFAFFLSVPIGYGKGKQQTRKVTIRSAVKGSYSQALESLRQKVPVELGRILLKKGWLTKATNVWSTAFLKKVSKVKVKKRVNWLRTLRRLKKVRKQEGFPSHLTLQKSSVSCKAVSTGYKKGATATGNALTFVHQCVFSATMGMRTGATKVVLVFTDGKTNLGQRPSSPADKIRNSGRLLLGSVVPRKFRQRTSFYSENGVRLKKLPKCLSILSSRTVKKCWKLFRRVRCRRLVRFHCILRHG